MVQTLRNFANDLASRYRAGETLAEIGDHYGVTRERVRQILHGECGLTGRDGGQAVRVKARANSAKKREDARYIHSYGMSKAEYDAINSAFTNGKRPIHYFTHQKTNSQKRSIEWDLTFAEWWLIWFESGKWFQRGRGKGKYVMARFSDSGPYAVGNVKIIEFGSNNSEYINRYWREVRSGKRALPISQQMPATHCKRGHPFDDENTYVSPSGVRQCRACARLSVERRKKRTPPNGTRNDLAND